MDASLASDAAAASGNGGSLLARTLLQDHSSRLEQHRSNFETLQREYLKLQQMFDTLKEENCQTTQNFAKMVSTSEEIIRQLQSERDEKILECDRLQQQVMSPRKLNKLRESIFAEMEGTYRKHIEELEMALQVRDSENAQLKRAYDYLKLEYNSLQTTSESRAKEIKQLHQSQMTHLKQQLKELSSRVEKDVPTEIQRIRQLQRQNIELDERIKQILGENKDLRTQLDENSSQKLQEVLALRQEAIHRDGTIEQLSSDKLSLTARLKRLESEQEESRKEIQSLSMELHQLQGDLLQSQRKCDDLIRQHEKVKDQLLLNNLQEVQSLQNEKDKCLREMEHYKDQITSLQTAVKQFENALSSKTQELIQAHEELTRSDREKAVLIEKERGELEEQLSKSQSLLLSKTQEYERLMSTLHDQLAALENDKLSLESETESMRADLDEKKSVLTQNAKELTELRGLKLSVQSLTLEKESLEKANGSLDEQLNLQSGQAQLLQQQFTACQTELRAVHENHQRELLKKKTEHSEAQRIWQNRERELTQQLRVTKKKKEKLKRQNENSLAELKKLLDVTTRKEQEMMAENERLKRCAEEEKRLLQKQLQNYQKHHQQFLLLLNSTVPDSVTATHQTPIHIESDTTISQ